jgi:hypothetical protein
MALTLQKRLNKLAKKKKRNSEQRKKRAMVNSSMIAVTGMLSIAMVAVGRVQHFAIISWSSAFLIFSLSGLLSAFCILFWKPKLSLSSFLVGGWMIYSMIIWSNRYFANEKEIAVSRPILKRWYGGKSGPYAKVSYEGVDQTLSAESKQILENSDRVDMIVVKGCFGYLCIKSVRFVKDR